jgi:hypothetical protein
MEIFYNYRGLTRIGIDVYTTVKQYLYKLPRGTEIRAKDLVEEYEKRVGTRCDGRTKTIILRDILGHHFYDPKATNKEVHECEVLGARNPRIVSCHQLFMRNGDVYTRLPEKWGWWAPGGRVLGPDDLWCM